MLLSLTPDFSPVKRQQIRQAVLTASPFRRECGELPVASRIPQKILRLRYGYFGGTPIHDKPWLIIVVILFPAALAASCR